MLSYSDSITKKIHTVIENNTIKINIGQSISLCGKEIPNPKNDDYIFGWLKEKYNYLLQSNKIIKSYKIDDGFAGKRLFILENRTGLLVNCGSGLLYIDAEFYLL